MHHYVFIYVCVCVCVCVYTFNDDNNNNNNYFQLCIIIMLYNNLEWSRYTEGAKTWARMVEAGGAPLAEFIRAFQN